MPAVNGQKFCRSQVPLSILPLSWWWFPTATTWHPPPSGTFRSFEVGESPTRFPKSPRGGNTYRGALYATTWVTRMWAGRRDRNESERKEMQRQRDARREWMRERERKVKLHAQRDVKGRKRVSLERLSLISVSKRHTVLEFGKSYNRNKNQAYWCIFEIEYWIRKVVRNLLFAINIYHRYRKVNLFFNYISFTRLINLTETHTVRDTWITLKCNGGNILSKLLNSKCNIFCMCVLRMRTVNYGWMFYVACRLDRNAMYFGFTTCNIISEDYRHSLKINYSNWILIKKKLKHCRLTERGSVINLRINYV